MQIDQTLTSLTHSVLALTQARQPSELFYPDLNLHRTAIASRSSEAFISCYDLTEMNYESHLVILVLHRVAPATTYVTYFYVAFFYPSGNMVI